MRQHLFVRLLTGGDITVEGSSEIDWRGRVPRALFALLALHPGEPQTRDGLAGLLWPESGQQAARRNVRMALMALRRSFHAVGLDILRADQETVTLALDADQVDIRQFEALALQPDLAARREALDLYRGDLLAGIPSQSETFDELLRHERRLYRDTALSTALAILEDIDPLDDGPAFDLCLRKILAIDPANEAAYRASMESAAARGDTSAALRLFDHYRDAMDESYDAPPSNEMIALRERIVAESQVPGFEAMVPIDRLAPRRDAPQRETSRSIGDRRKAWLVAGSVAAALAVLLVWAGAYSPWGTGRGLDATRGSEVHLTPVRGELTRCTQVDLASEVERLLVDALRTLSGVIVVLGGDRTRFRDLKGKAFTLSLHVACVDSDLRMTIELQNASTGVAEWIKIYDSDTSELNELQHRVLSDITPYLTPG